ncbi:MAG: hypothetical protein ACI92Z_003653 [Paracoccaceae bacterium]|jgi:hypothetical protein
MVQHHLEFDQRVISLGRKRRALSRGYVTRMRSDGLLVARPYRTRPRIPVKALILFVMAFVVFKGFLIANIGSDAYSERVAKLENGTVVEQAGAWVMQSDPVSDMVAQQIGPILR